MKTIFLLILVGYCMSEILATPAYPQKAGNQSVNYSKAQYPCEENLIEVLFVAESRVRLREGHLIDLSTSALTGLDPILQEFDWHTWLRMTEVPEETVDYWEVNGERNTGEDLYNLNNIYRLQIPTGNDPWKLASKLEALPGIYMARPVPKPMEPPTPNYQSQQGYLNPATNNPSGIDALFAWTQTGGTGVGVTVCDLEYSWNYNHADITKAVGSQINPNLISDPFNNNNHGTAVIGALVADNNGWGTTGICYGSSLKTCATYYNSSWNVAGAIAIATGALAAGDVIILEQQWDYTGNNGFIPIEWWTNYSPSSQTNNAVYAAIVNAIANGIHVVEAGGNGNINTGSLTWYGNSGAIIVGAGGASSSNNLTRLSFSSYGPRFDLQGWGENVVTTGYGDLYSLQGVNYYYTNTFSGTSSSSPVVAGSLACAEGYYLANISTMPPSPSYMRNHLITYGTAQITPPTGNIGPRPNTKAAIQNFPVNLLDFGDAPDGPYPTFITSNGARHTISILRLGMLIDGEMNGQPNASATGDDINPLTADDEDGVLFTSPIVPGSLATVQVIASAPCILNAWLDFNKINAWADPGEQIFINTILAAGANNLSFMVPAGVMPGYTFARFRINTQGGLTYFGPASEGEVEDYMVFIEESMQLDWGDAPDLPYPTRSASMGASHIIDGITFLGMLIDAEPDGQPDPMALGDDLDILYPPPNDDEDGIIFSGPLIPGNPGIINVTASVQGFLNAWFDFNRNGSWADPGEHVFIDLVIPAGISNLNFPVPPSASGQIYARFRFCTYQGLTFMGQAPNGEVEDYLVYVEPIIEYDWGDAPDSPYPTLGVNNGANHMIDGVTFLGTLIDSEPDGQPEPSAMGDDWDILYPPPIDDEDGITFPGPLLPGTSGIVHVTASAQGFLNAWFDFNNNGSWADAGEQAITDILLSAGLNTILFPIPGTAGGQTFARFRFCTYPGLTFTGSAQNGEVEDYVVQIEPQVIEYDWGDAPDSPYPTLGINNGANHQLDGITFLGLLVDPEPDGQPEPLAFGDDWDIFYPPASDDEDGVLFQWPLAKGNPCKLKVTASVGDGLFNGWIDFNGNGSWAEPNEHVFVDLNLLAGDNFLTFITPDTAKTGITFARFRFSHQPALSDTGFAFDGEVEDYHDMLIQFEDQKWQQLPDTLVPGIHVTETSAIADDWICNGGVVTDIHWWGNYEVMAGGVEKRGSGINHFLVRIYSDVSCLPGTLLKSWIVPFYPGIEIATGDTNNEGSPIYKYDFMLPEPFIQVKDSTYWLSLQAFSNDVANPPYWRWQEANRWLFPIHCKACINSGTGWQPIVWPFPPLLKYSDFAFRVTSWITDTLNLNNIVVTSGQDLCYDANMVIIVAGGGTTFTVNSGGRATMIAGQKISYLPGTKVNSGGYMNGYITTTGQFCNSLKASMVGNILPEPENEMIAETVQTKLLVYPNPTTGKLVIETKGIGEDASICFELYNLVGKRVMKETLPAGPKNEISLMQLPRGVYILRMTAGNETRMVKVIKQ